MEEERTVGLSKEDSAERRLTFLFHNLTYQARLRVVVDLMLVRDSDEGLSRVESWHVWRERAKEEGALQLLTAHISHAYVSQRFFRVMKLHAEGRPGMADELKHIEESPEFKIWQEACR